MNRNEAARIARRIEKAKRRLARGIDQRQERAGTVSERAVAARLSQLLEEKR
jgi:hypothetical protein